MDQPEKNDRNNNSRDKHRRRVPRSRFQMRVSTKHAPRKVVDGKPLSCATETTLKPEQHLELYRYLKLTRLVEERLVNLYRQIKVVGGVFRSAGDLMLETLRNEVKKVAPRAYFEPPHYAPAVAAARMARERINHIALAV